MAHTIAGVVYKNLIKPVLFRCDPETVHDKTTKIGERLENQEWLLNRLFAYQNTILRKTVLGLEFENPVGLAAGFDYNGHLAKVMKHVGFGFNTIGTVTAQKYEGNKPPRLARLPKSKSLLVNKGFKSDGAEIIARRLDGKKLSRHMIGISVGGSNVPEVNTTSKAIDDYLKTFNLFKDRQYVKYFELNISCPNIAMTESFSTLKNFQELVRAIGSLGITQPIFVKMPSEIALEESDALVRVALGHGIRGFIFSNLIKNRNNSALEKEEVAELRDIPGNFSGAPTAENSKRMVKHTRDTFGADVAIISCGGIFSATDAMERFSLGADLIQFITGMIYEGPQLAGEINRGIARFLATRSHRSPG
jgi:dihydroorotate dehydrogenase subfamily 2